MSDGLNDSIYLIKCRGRQWYAWNGTGLLQRGAEPVGGGRDFTLSFFFFSAKQQFNHFLLRNPYFLVDPDRADLPTQRTMQHKIVTSQLAMNQEPNSESFGVSDKIQRSVNNVLNIGKSC